MPSSEAGPARSVDDARDVAVRQIRRAGYAAVKDVPKARLDLGIAAYASAVIKDLQGRLEQLQSAEHLHGRQVELAVAGTQEHTALTFFLPGGQGQSLPSTLIVPGQVQRNDPERERLAVAKPLAGIVVDALTHQQTWAAELVPGLREISLQPARPEDLVLMALLTLRYSPWVQKVLQRESLRPLYHLNEAETAPAHTAAVALSLRAGSLLDRHFPLGARA